MFISLDVHLTKLLELYIINLLYLRRKMYERDVYRT